LSPWFFSQGRFRKVVCRTDNRGLCWRRAVRCPQGVSADHAHYLQNFLHAVVPPPSSNRPASKSVRIVISKPNSTAFQGNRPPQQQQRPFQPFQASSAVGQQRRTAVRQQSQLSTFFSTNTTAAAGTVPPLAVHVVLLLECGCHR